MNFKDKTVLITGGASGMGAASAREFAAAGADVVIVDRNGPLARQVAAEIGASEPLVGDVADHALLSPSSAHRWVPCPKSVMEEQRYPEETTSYAREGHAAHELASFLIMGGGLDASDTIGTLVAGVTVTPEMALHVQAYVDFVRARPGEHWVEYSVPISEWTGEPGAKGTADHIAIAPGDARGDILYVTDLKFGVGHRVEAEGNYQLRMYGLGALTDPGYLANIKHVVMTIVQTRLDHISSVEMPIEELVEWGETVLRPAAQRAMDPEAPYGPGAEQCRFCRARHECPARRELVLDTITQRAWEAGDPPHRRGHPVPQLR